jgi:nicotinic acid mononucleotide adenylyltransferase
MATQIDPNKLDFEERFARLRLMIEESEKFSAETRKLVAESKSVSLATVFQGAIAIAALLGAGAAIAKLFFP